MLSVTESHEYVTDIQELATNYAAADQNVCAGVCWVLSHDPTVGSELGDTGIRVVYTVPGHGLPHFLAHFYRIQADGSPLLLRARTFGFFDEEDST